MRQQRDRKGIYPLSNWLVVRTNIKREAKAEEMLARAGFSTYAPHGKIERFSKRKKVFRETDYRMMPRYLFVEARPVDAGIIRQCEGVESILGIGGCPISLDKDGQTALAMLIAAEANLEFDETRAGKLHRQEIGRTKKETTRMRFKPGSRILIKKGPFATFAAEVTNVNGRGAIKAMISVFGRMTDVEVPASWAEMADQAA